MILGIDASSIRAGGGVTHLVELLAVASPQEFGFSRVVVWASTDLLARIEDRPWLEKAHHPFLDRSLGFRILWQTFALTKLARAQRCDVLFVLGGSYVTSFRPVVTFNQNLLPFDFKELKRFGPSFRMFKMLALRYTQSRSFARADGVVFLTRQARDVVLSVIGRMAGRAAVIPHGVDDRFHAEPRPQLPIDHYSADRPFCLLYVSTVNSYKHHWHVVEAVHLARQRGLPVILRVVGSSLPQPMARFEASLKRFDPDRQFVTYVGEVEHEQLPQEYFQADAFIFASTCETFGQIVTEAMSSGLPITCSNRSAMPELLEEAAVYFDPEDPVDIARGIEELLISPDRRASLAAGAFEKARMYSWRRCASETFSFLAGVAQAGGATGVR